MFDAKVLDIMREKSVVSMISASDFLTSIFFYYVL